MKRLLFSILIVAALVGAVFTPASIVMAASATRSLPPSAVAGASFDVVISTADYGAFGQVVETLPAEFSYLSSTLSEAAVDVNGQVVTFTLLEGDTPFTYIVAASSTAGIYTFGGILKDEDKTESTLSGDTEIIVPAARSLPSSVGTGDNFNVSLSTFDYGAFGQVVETLPAGFSYVSSTLSEAAVDVDGQVVTFTLLEGDTAFTYIVAASSTADTYTFGGILKDENKTEYDVGEDQITVTATPTPSGGGGGGGSAPTYYTDTDLFGTEARFRISSDGEIQETIEATSDDGMLTITIPEGTIALDKDGDRLDSLETAVDQSPPDPPEDANIIGLAYDFGPDGATFDPAITFTWSYDPEALPEGVAEEDLVIAYYDEAIGEWVELDFVLDTGNNTITASVEHFTTFVILGAPSVVEVAELEEAIGELETQVASLQDEIAAAQAELESAQTQVASALGDYNTATSDVTTVQAQVTSALADYDTATSDITAAQAGVTSAQSDLAKSQERLAEAEDEIAELEAAPITWGIIGSIIAGVVVIVGLLVYFLWWRRRLA